MVFFDKYKTWSLPTKIAVWGVLIGTILTIVGLCFSIYPFISEKTGVEVTPQEISIGCSGVGVTKTITVTNYDDQPVENYALTISQPLGVGVRHDLQEIGSNSLRGAMRSMQLSDNTFMHSVYPLASIKPNSVVEFDLTIYPDKCLAPYSIYINKEEPVTLGGRINCELPG
ncbi:TPA: hypothetical protein HA251_06210 [Candidatus Woesearchaeota archaeon]|nr:hypothetical protein [Candidatus Woesearchaeota archaeon]